MCLQLLIKHMITFQVTYCERKGNTKCSTHILSQHLSCETQFLKRVLDHFKAFGCLPEDTNGKS